MRLTQILLRFAKRPPRGDVNRGKYRYPVQLSHIDISRGNERLEIEENNMMLLRNPYLTFEQSYGHSLALGNPKKFIDEKYIKQQKIKPDVTFEERYAGLNKQDVWD